MAIMIIAAFTVGGVALWYFFGRGEAAPEEQAAPAEAKSYRCKVCDKSFPAFLAAHTHVTGEHGLAGHKLDEAIVPE